MQNHFNLDASVINPTGTHSTLKFVRPNVAYIVAPRANGKTFIIGDHIDDLNDAMPRSQIILFSDTFKRLEERIVPNILSYFINDAGMIEGEDYVCYRKPPEHWTKPLIPLKEFEHVISFSSGMALCLASQAVPGSANAYNAQALIVDETKYCEEVVINTEVLPALRGSENLFGHLPEYRSQWYFTDKFGEKIKWVLAKKKLSNNNLAKAIIEKQKKIFQLQHELETLTSTSTRQVRINEIATIEEKLNKVRCSMIYFHDAKPYENIDRLGKKYFRDLKRQLPKSQYAVAIENKEQGKADNSFYPALDETRHYYTSMIETSEEQELVVSMDYGWRITPMVVGQFGLLPGNTEMTYNIVNGIHTVHPDSMAYDAKEDGSVGGIQSTVKEFCDYYATRMNKTVYYVYDHTAVPKRPDGKCFKDLAIEEFYKHDWIVIEKHMGKAPFHHDKHEEFKKVMSADSVMLNKIRAWAPIKSLENAGTKLVKGKTAKEKAGEKPKDISTSDPIEQTDYSDAFDMQVYAVLVQELITPNESGSGSVADFSFGFRR